MNTFGPAYDRRVDEPALTTQRDNIRSYLLHNSNGWYTLAQLSLSLGYPEASISSQLRHLRKFQFGSWKVDKRRRSGLRVWEYRLRAPNMIYQPDLL